MGGFDGGECDQPVKFFIWPSEVDTFKRRILAALIGVNIGVSACPSLPPIEKAAWDVFFHDRQQFLSGETPTFGSYDHWNQTCATSHTLDEWQAKLTKLCDIPGPDPKKIPGANTAPFDAIKWVAIAAAVVAGVVLIKPYLPTPRRKR